jgi:FKBP-type peptidyl-prolyl cis-trans isomerase 2
MISCSQDMPAIVKDVKEDEVFIDMNHPLAGKDLNFKVKVVAIN